VRYWLLPPSGLNRRTLRTRPTLLGGDRLLSKPLPSLEFLHAKPAVEAPRHDCPQFLDLRRVSLRVVEYIQRSAHHVHDFSR